MRKSIIKLFIIIMLSFVCIGCWDAIDIDSKNLITTVIVDKTELGYAFYVEVAPQNKNPSNEGGQTQKGIIQRSEGKTFSDARKNLDLLTNRPLYLGANQVIIFTEEMANYSIEEYVYRIRNMAEYRKTMNFVMIREKAEDILNANTENQELIGLSIDELINTLKDEGQAINLTFSETLEYLASPIKNYLMPIIGLKEKNMIGFDGYAVFLGGTNQGIILPEDIEGIVLLKAKKAKNTMVIQNRDLFFTVDYELKKRKIKVDYDDNTISFTIKMEINSKLLYLEKPVTVDETLIKELSLKLKSLIEEELIRTINKSQNEFGLDYLGFYTAFRLKFPDQSKVIDWEKEYKNVNFSYDISVDLRASGNLDFNP